MYYKRIVKYVPVKKKRSRARGKKKYYRKRW